MIKKVLVTLCMLVNSITSHASLIEYNGYSRDSASDIVTGGGLEWLKWDLTARMDFESALASYSADGWVLASHTQMVSMFNSFQFGKSNWTEQAQENDEAFMDWTPDEESPHNYFIRLFGMTEEYSCSAPYMTRCSLPYDPYVLSVARYGVEGINNFNIALVLDDFTHVVTPEWVFQGEHTACLVFNRLYCPNIEPVERGFAFVRTPTQSDAPKPVPLPASLSLFALGLIGLVYRNNKILRT